MSNRAIVSCSLMVVIAVLTGCEQATVAPPESTDPWFNPPPADTSVELEPVPAAAFYVVPAELIAEAKVSLDEIAISQISPGEADYFAGQVVKKPDVTRPFLVRALYRTKREFSVNIRGNALWVTSNDIANDKGELQQQPLLLMMDEVPETIYVTTGPPTQTQQ